MTVVSPSKRTARQGDPHPARSGDRSVLVARLLLGIVITVAAATALFPSNPISLVVVIGAIPVMLILVGRRYGWRLLAVYLAATFIVSNVFENMSIVTGFPFGHYHYPGDSPRIWHFPVMIAVYYCVLGLISWLTASALLDGADLRLADRGDPARRINLVALPAMAAALMTMWDLGVDPAASTIGKTWVWEHGGGVFGVPWTNYLGWWFVSYVFFQIFALVLATRGRPSAGPRQQREPLGHAVILYFMLGMASLPAFVTAPHTTVTDAAGAVWSVHALHETLFTINLFGTVVIAVLAAVKLARNDLSLHQR
ncbi:carotenoid biosynthesis protein [Kitasatospora sp. NPDC051914]|uniref:carotenoid biosynthesis protein n=1 Tax=Kitasatospora sp. NPDC051914 TaxID=3154945 RepID=UPI003431844F